MYLFEHAKKVDKIPDDYEYSSNFLCPKCNWSSCSFESSLDFTVDIPVDVDKINVITDRNSYDLEWKEGYTCPECGQKFYYVNGVE